MRKIIYLLILAFIFLGVIGYAIAIVLTSPGGKPVASATPSATKNSSSSPIATESEKTTVKVYMIKLADNGPVGCGDFLIPVDRQIPKTTTILRATLDELLSLRRTEFPDAQVYSSLFSSNLKTESVSIVNGKAIIKLTGTVSLGGVCDSPRVEAQLTETAKQFPTVKEVEIFINNQPIKDVLSEKG